MTMEKAREPVKLYPASPLGFTEEGRDYIRNRLIPALRKLENVVVLDPWAGVLEMSEEQIRRITSSLRRNAALGYGKGNFGMIDQSSIVLANLNGPDPDSGTCIEIGYAHGKGKLAVGYRTDYRASGESRYMTVNLQVEAAIMESNGKLFRSLEDAVAFIRKKTGAPIRSK